MMIVVDWNVWEKFARIMVVVCAIGLPCLLLCMQ